MAESGRAVRVGSSRRGLRALVPCYRGRSVIPARPVASRTRTDRRPGWSRLASRGGACGNGALHVELSNLSVFPLGTYQAEPDRHHAAHSRFGQPTRTGRRLGQMTGPASPYHAGHWWGRGSSGPGLIKPAPTVVSEGHRHETKFRGGRVEGEWGNSYSRTAQGAGVAAGPDLEGSAIRAASAPTGSPSVGFSESGRAQARNFRSARGPARWTRIRRLTGPVTVLRAGAAPAEGVRPRGGAGPWETTGPSTWAEVASARQLGRRRLRRQSASRRACRCLGAQACEASFHTVQCACVCVCVCVCVCAVYGQNGPGPAVDSEGRACSGP